MDHHAFQDALKASGGLRIAGVISGETGQIVVNEFGQIGA